MSFTQTKIKATENLDSLRDWFFDELLKLREREIKILKEYDAKKQAFLQQHIDKIKVD